MVKQGIARLLPAAAGAVLLAAGWTLIAARERPLQARTRDRLRPKEGE